MAPLNWSQATHETRMEIWTQWFEGKSAFRIIMDHRGKVTQPAVERILREGPPEELVHDPRFNSVHRYKAYAVDGLLNSLTGYACLYILLKVPDRIGPSQVWRGVRIIDKLLNEVGGYLLNNGTRGADIDEDLFLEASEAGIPAFHLDLSGKVYEMEFDFSVPDPDPLLVPVTPGLT